MISFPSFEAALRQKQNICLEYLLLKSLQMEQHLYHCADLEILLYGS